jgi:hypothetical protein
VRTTCSGREKVAGVIHAERREDVFLDVDVFWFAGDFLDQRAKQNEADVAAVPDHN